MQDLFYVLGSIEGLIIVIVSIFIASRIATIIDMLRKKNSDSVDSIEVEPQEKESEV